MQHFNVTTIKNWDKHFRANFINCLSGYKSATLIGTVNALGKPNLAIFSNIVHVGADPAIIGFINRPKAATPHTLANIEATGVYTMNHIHPSFIHQAHQTSAKYAEQVNEFEAVGLTMEWKNNIIAPFVAESKVQYAMKVLDIIPIKQNGTYFITGIIEDVFVTETIIQDDGFLHLENVGTITSLGISGYYLPQPLQILPYAKPTE